MSNLRCQNKRSDYELTLENIQADDLKNVFFVRSCIHILNYDARRLCNMRNSIYYNKVLSQVSPQTKQQYIRFH